LRLLLTLLLLLLLCWSEHSPQVHLLLLLLARQLNPSVQPYLVQLHCSCH
jgi:hypothetical protein